MIFLCVIYCLYHWRIYFYVKRIVHYTFSNFSCAADLSKMFGIAIGGC
jgi:hypothetical protein